VVTAAGTGRGRLLPGSAAVIAGIVLLVCAMALLIAGFLGLARNLEGTRAMHDGTPLMLDLRSGSVLVVYEVTAPRERVRAVQPNCTLKFLETGLTATLTSAQRAPVTLPREATYTPLLEYAVPFTGEYSLECSRTPAKLVVGPISEKVEAKISAASFWFLFLAVVGVVCIVAGRMAGRRFDAGEEPAAQVPLPPMLRT
jgi:hypothetical protein